MSTRSFGPGLLLGVVLSSMVFLGGATSGTLSSVLSFVGGFGVGSVSVAAMSFWMGEA